MANLFSIEEPITFESVWESSGSYTFRRSGDTTNQSVADIGNEVYADFDINNIQTMRIDNIILTQLPNTAQADLRENTFSFIENGGLIFNCELPLHPDTTDILYTRYFLSEQTNNGFKATVMLPTGQASDFNIIPSYTTLLGGVWRYTFTNNPHYFATIIPNFTQYEIPSSIEELTRNGEAYNARTTAGNLQSKEYRYTYTLNTNVGTLEIKDDDYKQHYRLFEASANASQFTNVDIEAEPRLVAKRDREIRLGDRFYGKVVLSKESVELVNTDAKLNELAKNDLLGRRAFLYDVRNGTTTSVYAGIVEEYSTNLRTLKIDIGASQSLTDTSFLETIQDTYDIDSDELIPIIYGKVYDCPLLLVSENTNDDDYIAGTSDDQYQFSNLRYSDGTTVSTADYTVSQSGIKYTGSDRDKAKNGMVCDVVSNRGNDSYTESVSPIRIIENLLNSFSNLSYTTRNFDTSEINNQNINSISYRATKQTVLQSLNEILEKCFLFFIYKDTGLYSIRKIDYNETTHEIDQNLIVGAPEYTKSRKNQASSVRLLYKKKENENNDYYSSHTNTEYENEGIRNTGLKRTQTFETLYTDQTDIETLADTLAERLSGNRIILKIKVSELPNNINLLDKLNITVQVNRHDLLPEIVYTVIGISRSEKTLSLEGFL